MVADLESTEALAVGITSMGPSQRKHEQVNIRLAIVVSHPIQHFVPFYRRLAVEQGIQLCVFFMSDFSVKTFFDLEMATHIEWKMDLLAGYQYKFLAEAGQISEPTPRQLNNPSISRELSEFSPDVVLTYGYNQITQLRVLWWCQRNRVPIMMISDSTLQRHRYTYRRLMKWAVLPRLLSRYSAFLTVGDSNELYLRSYGAPVAKLFRSPFTIDEDLYLDARTDRRSLRDQFRRENNIEPKEFVALIVGKLSPRKRPLDVIEAATVLQSSGVGGARIRFVFAGDGVLKEKVEEMSAQRGLCAISLGFVGLDRLPKVYCGADVLVHPAEVDPHPLVMSEATCLGIPIIVSDRVGAIGPGDIARPGENALVYQCGDVSALASAIKCLIEEPDRRTRMSQAALSIWLDQNTARSIHGFLAATRHCLGVQHSSASGLTRSKS
jgi:glycosyltransferase involved in cell wall biosynthesis